MNSSVSEVLAIADQEQQPAIDRVLEWMAIPGRSGEEGAIAEAVRQACLAAGVPASAIKHDQAQRKSPIGGQVGNLIIKLPGTIRGPRRLLMAHLDTVPLCVGCRPYRDGEYIRNRAAGTGLGGDNRAGVSAVISAVSTILKHNLPHPPLTILLTVQEEIGLRGSRNVSLSALGAPKLCFNWDGREAHTVIIAATGDTAIEITIHGIPSHAGATPERGVSAAAIAAKAIADLVENGFHGLIEKRGGTGTGNVGVLSGGAATNVVMPELQVRAEVRSHDPKFREKLVETYRKAFEKAARSLKNVSGQRGHIDFHAESKYDSFRLDPQAECIRIANAAVEAAGLQPEPVVANGGLDANWLTAHGLPTVTLGCGQRDIHTADESLHVPTYLNACRVATLIATGTI